MRYVLVIFLAFGLACGDSSTNEGDRYFQQGNYQSAVAAYDEYLQNHQSDVKTLYNRGRSFEELGKTTQAIKDFESVLALDEVNTNAMVSLAKVYYNSEKYSMSLIHAGKALEINENLPQAHFLQGRARHQLGYFERALESYSLAVKLNDSFGEAYLYRGALKVQLNRVRKACEDFKKANNLNIQEAKSALNKYCQ